MKLLHIMGTLALMCSSILSANEMGMKNDVVFSSKTLNLPELLSHVEDTVGLIIEADDETCQLAYHELKESLKVVYTFNCLYRNEASTILQVLDECYADLIDAIDENPDSIILRQSLSLFTSGRNYDTEALTAQSLQEWTDINTSAELKSAIENVDADLIYIQENARWDAQAVHSPSLILYNTHSFQNSIPKVLIIKSSKDKSEYKAEAGIDVRLGGKDHGKASCFVKGEAKDKNGNYAKGKISKEEG